MIRTESEHHLSPTKDLSIDRSITIAEALCDSVNSIPSEFQEDLFARIEYAHIIYKEGLRPEEERDSVFLVHPRDSKANIRNGIYYGDADGAFPALSYIFSEDPKYNQSLQEGKVDLLNSLPPFEVATMTTQTQGEEDLHGSIVCIPFDIDKMLSFVSSTERIKGYARPLIRDATDFILNKLRTPNIGLGEQLAAMTQFGEWLKKSFDEDIYPTTGHAGTIYAMAETLRLGAEKLDLDLSSETIGIIGCGRIGSAFAKFIESQQMVGNLILFDRASGVADKLAKDILLERMKKNGHVIKVAKNYQEILDGTNLIVSAVSDPILGDITLNGHFVVDDSQPPWLPPLQGSGIIAWPSYTHLDVQRNGILMTEEGSRSETLGSYIYGPHGLIPQTWWGCEAELISLLKHNRMKEGHISRAVEVKDVIEIGNLVKDSGFSVNQLQSWGEVISDASLDRLRSNI